MCRRHEAHEEPDAWRHRMAGQKSSEQLDAVAPVISEA